MNKLRANPYRAASRLVVACLLLLVFGGVAWSQTVYSTPVRVTNTPLPVAATEAAPLYVAPAGSRMAVQVVNAAVNVTAASPLPVTAPSPLPVTMSGTLPVAQQGTVTVAPAGGEMQVTGTVAIHGTPTVTLSGTPQVTLSGTPQVTLSSTGNTVKLAGTPVIRQWAVILSGDYFTDWILAPDFLDKAIEAETVTATCSFPIGQKPVKTIFQVRPLGGGDAAFPVPMTMTGSSPDYALDFWAGSLPGKVYIPGDAAIRFQVVRTPHMTDAECWVSLSGRMHDSF